VRRELFVIPAYEAPWRTAATGAAANSGIARSSL
jgi:hypothetical protein